MAKIFGIHAKAPSIDAQSYAINITGSVSNPSLGAGTTLTASWERDGGDMIIRMDLVQSSAGSAGSGNYLFSIPSTYAIDLTKMPQSGNFITSNVGSADALAGGILAVGYVSVFDSTHLGMAVYASSVSAAAAQAVSSGSYGLNGSSIQYSFTARVPIVGWSANDTLRVSDNSKI